MSLRRKAALLGLAQLAVMVVIVLMVGAAVTGYYVQRSERQDAEEAMHRVKRVIDAETQSLEVTARDWSAWTQTYDFVRRRNPGYVEDNLAPDTVSTLGLTAMLFYDEAGHLVHAEWVDPDSGAPALPPAHLIDLIARSPSLLRHATPSAGKAGMLSVGEVHLLAVSQPIVPNDARGMPAGTLLMAKAVSGALMQRVQDISGVPFQMYCVGSASLPAAAGAALPGLYDQLPVARGTQNVPVDVRPIDGREYAATALMSDVLGNPSCVIRVVRPRTDYIRGITSVRHLAATVLVLGLIGGGVAAWSWDRFLYGRLARLTQSVRAVGESGDPSRRVARPGRQYDELAELASALNATLDRLEAARREAAEADERFATVLKEASDCVILVDADSLQLLRANSAFFRMTGRGADELADITLRDVLGETADEIRDGVAAADSRPRHFRSDRACVLAGGRSLELEIAADRVSAGGNDLILVLGRDVSERKRIEQLKNDFTSMISHELRSPLTTIIGWATLLERDLGAGDSDMRKRAVHQIQRKGDEMRRLVEDLLNVNRIQSGRLTLTLEETDPATLVEECARGAELSPGHTLDLDIEAGLPPLRCDLERLAYVINNLVRNAVKFSPEGGPVRVSAKRRQEHLVIRVTDRGVGIPTEELPTVFDRFVQADMSSTRKFGGFGLGLYIAKSIVEAHGGKCSVKSDVGKGSAFTVKVPFAGPASSAATLAGGDDGLEQPQRPAARPAGKLADDPPRKRLAS